MKRCLSLLLAVIMFLQPALVALPRPAAAQGQIPAQSNSPCDDPHFVALRTKPLDQMSPREYDYFLMKDKECTEFRRLQLEKSAPLPDAAPMLQTEPMRPPQPQGEAAPAAPPSAELLSEACERGKNDGAGAGGAVGYGIGAFFCGILGYALAAGSTPSVPADRIAGKSPEYTTAYTRCYQQEAKRKNTQAACIGWSVGAAVSVTMLAISASSQ